MISAQYTRYAGLRQLEPTGGRSEGYYHSVVLSYKHSPSNGLMKTEPFMVIVLTMWSSSRIWISSRAHRMETPVSLQRGDDICHYMQAQSADRRQEKGFQDRFSSRKFSSVSFEAKQINKTLPNLT